MSWDLKIFLDYKVRTHQGIKNKADKSLETFQEHL